MLTDEMTELYSAQETLEFKLDRILAVISNEPDKVEEVNKHLLASPRKDELEALSETMKSWTIRVENVNYDLINVQDDLTFDIDSIFEITESSRCPEINKCQNEKIVNSLIDTGSEVTAILKNTAANSLARSFLKLNLLIPLTNF